MTNPTYRAISTHSAHVHESLTDIESSFSRDLKYFENGDRKHSLRITHLHGVFNDARLPGFSIDVEKREIEFDGRNTSQDCLRKKCLLL